MKASSLDQNTLQPWVFSLSLKPKTLLNVWLFSLLVAFGLSGFGRYAIPTMSGDWAQDMVVVETYYHNAIAPREHPFILEGEDLVAYPQWSFRVVADTAARFHLDPLRSLQIWSIIWLISGCYLIALRLTFLRDGLPPLTTIGITSLYLAICAYFGFGMRGHIEGNFFYPQLSATTLALAGVFVLQRFKLNYNIAALFVILWGGVVIPNFHLIPAAWFSFSGVIVLALIAANLRQRFIYPPIIGLVTVYSWTHQGGSKMASLANNNGWFLIRAGQLSDHGTWVAAGLSVAISLMLVTLFLLRRTSLDRDPYRRLIPYSGTIAIIVLICLQSALYCGLHQGSIYAIVKYSYLLAIEGALLISSIGPFLRIDSEKLLLRTPAFKLSCVILFFCAQGPVFMTLDDQTSLMQMRNKLLRVEGTLDRNHRTYPQFPGVDYDRRFYLASAVMRIPRDQRTLSWLLRGSVGEEPFVWPAWRGKILNADFESGEALPWLPYDVIITNISSKSHRGKFALAEISGRGSVYQDVKELEPGGTYTVSAWMCGPSATTATAWIAAWDASTNTTTSSMATKPKSDWTPLAVEAVASSQGVLRVHLFRSEGDGAIVWDDVEIVADK